MGYTLIDIIDSLIEIEAKAIQIYETISIKTNVPAKLMTVSNVLITEEKRHIQYYEEMKDRLKEEELVVDFEIYNKISSFLFEFKKLVQITSAITIDELLEYALSLEVINVGLLKQIQGAFVGKNFEKHKKNYNIISEMIEQEAKHVSNLKIFMKLR